MSGCVQKGATATTGTLQNTAEKGPKTIGIVDSKDSQSAKTHTMKSTPSCQGFP